MAKVKSLIVPLLLCSAMFACPTDDSDGEPVRDCRYAGSLCAAGFTCTESTGRWICVEEGLADAGASDSVISIFDPDSVSVEPDAVQDTRAEVPNDDLGGRDADRDPLELDARSDTVGSDLRPQSEICDNERDDDGDTTVDCLDVDCASAINCQLPLTETDCDNMQDDDGDRLFDCQDLEDCASDPACVDVGIGETMCGDMVDNDEDSFEDCTDADCAADQACAPRDTEICTNMVDDDADLATDCDDADCVSDSACAVGGGGLGQGDLANLDFENLLACFFICLVDEQSCATCLSGGGSTPQTETHCGDSNDNDGDGAADCLDIDCRGTVWCPIETDCANRVDDDSDLATDCDDTDCRGSRFCP